MIKYPIGIHTFEGIKREKYVYVDKTELIYRLKRGGRHYLLCRPRLFGKSLLLSTMQSYFKGEKELFNGLMLGDLEKSWHHYAVLKFDFCCDNQLQQSLKEGIQHFTGSPVHSTVQDSKIETANDNSVTDSGDIQEIPQPKSLENILDSQLGALEKIYGREESETIYKDRFLGIIERAFESSKHGVMILIDNYDSPILSTMEDVTLQRHYIELLTGFYHVLALAQDKIRFSFICGITPIGKSTFLKGYVYSGCDLPHSCNLKAHYKNADFSKLASNDSSNNSSNDSLANNENAIGVSNCNNYLSNVANTTEANNSSSNDHYIDIPQTTPVSCPVTHELVQGSESETPLLGTDSCDEGAQSSVGLVNPEGSISATNEDSRFAATASADFIPMDADPTVKVFIPASETDAQSSVTTGESDSKTAGSTDAVELHSEVDIGVSDAGNKDCTNENNSIPASITDKVNNTADPFNNTTNNSNDDQLVANASSDSCDASAQTQIPEGTAFIRDISLDSAFTGLCGFSEDEIQDNMRQGLEQLAQYKETDIQSVMEALSRRYYGYHFNIKGHGKFNPYDVFNALSQDRIGDYWCHAQRQSGLNELVISKIMSTDFDMRLLKECKIAKTELEQDPMSAQSPIPLLYQCGYLTIVGHGPQDKMYYLSLSNKEVREEFLSELLDCYGCFHPEKNNYITGMLEDLQNGFPDIFVIRMKSFFQDPEDAGYCRYYPQTSALKMTNFQLYCQNILYLVFTLLSKDVLDTFGQEIGYEINEGNAELIMQLEHCVYIFEFVLDQDINSALHLIQQRHLQVPVIYEDKQIVKVCVSISSELHNISSWFVEKDDSPEYQSEGDQASAFPLFSPPDL